MRGRAKIDGRIGIEKTYQNHTAAPDINLAPRVQAVTNDKFWGGVAGTAAARLHEIAFPVAVGFDSIQPSALNEFAIRQTVLFVLRQFLVRVEGIREAEICDDDVPIPIKEQILELQIPMHNPLLVQIANS